MLGFSRGADPVANREREIKEETYYRNVDFQFKAKGMKVRVRGRDLEAKG